jgi:hypothetical protein
MRNIWQLALLPVAIVAMALPAMAQEVTGDAVAGLVSRQAKGEVHLSIDPKLADGRLVLRIVVVNRSGAVANFAPGDVKVTSPEGVVIALVPRAELLAEQASSGQAGVETSQAYAGAAVPIVPGGQANITTFTGAANGGTAGIPQAVLARSGKPSPATVALDAVLLKPVVLKPGAVDGGQVVTTKLRRSKTPNVTVWVAFAGEDHRFQVAVPKR